MKNKLLKKFISLFLALALLVSMGTPVYATDNSIKVQFNGENISFEVAPQIVNSRVLVPMRAIFEKLGADVKWDGQNRVVTATKEGTVVKLGIDSREASVSKEGSLKEIILDTPAVIVRGRTLVPVRFLSESLGIQVGWDQANRTVILVDYDYFINKIKIQAPDFYQFINNQYVDLKTGEITSSSDMSFKHISNVDSSEDLNASFASDIKAIINEENESMDGVVKLAGLEKFLMGSGLENVDDISFNVRIDNNSIYLKSNLLSLLKQYNINVGDKWIKVDIADLGIPDVTTLQDLKEKQKNPTVSQLLDAVINTPMDLDVNSFAEAEQMFNILITLVDNNHFTVTTKGGAQIYSWKINKQDLIDTVLAIQKSSPAPQNMTLEEIIEMKKVMDSLVFDFNMEVKVQDNIIVSTEIYLNTKMDIPEDGHYELYLKSSSEVTNPNKGEINVSLPNPSNVIDLKELLASMEQGRY